MEALRKLQNRIDALSVRERGIVLGATIALTYFVFNLFVYQSIETRQKQIQTKLLQNNSMVAALTSQLGQLSNSDARDKKEQARQEIRRLRNELTLLDQELRQSTKNLVSPAQMASMLQMVLTNTDGLTMRRVKSLGSQPLLPARISAEEEADENDAETEGSANNTVVNNAYRHGLQIEIDGDFFSTLEYLKKLEALEWSFFWDEIKFKVSEYPEATSILSIHTISLDKNWIGA